MREEADHICGDLAVEVSSMGELRTPMLERSEWRGVISVEVPRCCRLSPHLHHISSSSSFTKVYNTLILTWPLCRHYDVDSCIISDVIFFIQHSIQNSDTKGTLWTAYCIMTIFKVFFSNLVHSTASARPVVACTIFLVLHFIKVNFSIYWPVLGQKAVWRTSCWYFFLISKCVALEETPRTS